MIAKLFIRSSQRLIALNARFFSTNPANQFNNQETSSTYQNQRNNRREPSEFRRNNQERYQKREGEEQYRPRKESITWDEYFNLYATNKIHNISEAKFPYNFRGMQDFVPIKKEFDNMIFAKGENYADFCKQFDRRMVWFMKSLATNKDDDLPYSELNFLLQAKKGAELLRRNGYQINLIEDNEGFQKFGGKKGGQPFEITHIMGLNSNRTRNAGTDAYSIIRDLEEKGLIMFIGNQLKMDENGNYDFKLTRDDDKQMILRVHYKFATPYILQVTDSSGKVVSPPPESYIHTAVFENQLRLPPKFSRLDLHFLDWIKLYRIQNEWKLVDFDRFLSGNKLIYSEKEQRQLFKGEKDN
ncbi:hypothetical protein TTHERM_00853090 (macronuclear) [Tetrahymena thermophila SB210]|uniref:Uncharacterized protein n=1 Tax=Tetrahymena thermophila (strain SB210) TaxID=312017 RepID=Q24E31_TETTS|nr:hypothetical protein TTHERM_00853090 [Tetrahymena thermophila SB210]EAS06070.3 hypothetical protein TTHERM_00853090 [Tetrahymena thermophila SB210]6Z1P_BM Chain BM, mS81 [Tetrahymena thermophila SB210]|eukprot:XP_001026315.3 hypothetical protein TTHERM_00853090 [Tetrahymena thermophila SB210]